MTFEGFHFTVFLALWTTLRVIHNLVHGTSVLWWELTSVSDTLEVAFLSYDFPVPSPHILFAYTMGSSSFLVGRSST